MEVGQQAVPMEMKSEDVFLLKEYEEIRKEMMARTQELWQLEKFAFGGAAAIAAWLFANAPSVKAIQVAWWLPFIFLVICTVRFCSGMYHLSDRASEYLQTIEKHFIPERGGWEIWFKKQGPNETLAYSFAWLVALLAAFLIPFLAN